MLKTKRTVVASIAGVFFGFLCLGLASTGPGALPWPVSVQIVVSRSLIGFAIGISLLRLGHWSVHGIVMGMLFSLPLAFSGLMAPDSPEYNNPAYSKTSVFVNTVILAGFVIKIIMGMLYGFLIEVITSVVFKARREA